MEQQMLLALLNEAALERTSQIRLNEICERLVDAATTGRLVTGEARGFRCIIEALFDQIDEQREKLPDMFPVFALMCGNRSDWGPIAQIDWSLIQSGGVAK